MAAEFKLQVAADIDEAAINQCLEASYAKLMVSSYDDRIIANALPHITSANPRLIASGRTVGCGGWSLERPGSGEIVSGASVTFATL